MPDVPHRVPLRLLNPLLDHAHDSWRNLRYVNLMKVDCCDPPPPKKKTPSMQKWRDLALFSLSSTAPP